MATNQTTRVLELLKRFNHGEKVCISALQHEYLWEGKNERTVRRDLNVIKEAFPESFELVRGDENGCYKAITNQAFDNFMKPEVLSMMVQTFNLANKSDLFKNFDLDDSDKRILESKIKEANKCYLFKNKPFETHKDDMVIFKKLESAIKYQKFLTIDYEVGSEIKTFEVKPYKIVFINENFYLACEIEHETLEFAMYRISKIKALETTSRTYQVNREISDFINDMQTPFATYRRDYKKHLIDVEIEVDSAKAYFFNSKQHLKSQKIIEKKENGNLIVSYQVTKPLEVEELIKKWLPHAKVLKPLSLKEKIEGELRRYLAE